jgi:hypothetical protein
LVHCFVVCGCRAQCYGIGGRGPAVLRADSVLDQVLYTGAERTADALSAFAKQSKTEFAQHSTRLTFPAPRPRLPKLAVSVLCLTSTC